jgi:hypothetical protein
MSVRNRVLPEGNQRVFGATVIASVMLFGVACHSGVESPTSPSTTTGSVPTVTSAALTIDGDTAATRGGQMSFTMDELDSSGYSGECTIGTGGAGFRLKATGNGKPNTMIRFQLQDPETTLGPVDITEVDARGVFRTGQDRITFLSSGQRVRCIVMGGPGDPAILATGPIFDIP